MYGYSASLQQLKIEKTKVYPNLDVYMEICINLAYVLLPWLYGTIFIKDIYQRLYLYYLEVPNATQCYFGKWF